MLRVLIIEDEPSYTEALQVALPAEGFMIEAADDGPSGLKAFKETAPDIVLLDLMLPGLSGLDVLRKIRKRSTTPVIVLSAKDTETDIVAALELGADDYLTKPYSVRELVARIRAAARRYADSGEPELLSLGLATLDVGRHQLRLNEDATDLPRKEFALLAELMARPGMVVRREDLLEEVWGLGWERDTKTLDQHIRRLRRRLEAVEGAPVIE
ncbi:MAG: response regulator transcription factor, partial [Acidimicrobiia bacterium]|nr:response regulator transcription factor [Acidimicrobiia bacterium]